MDLTREDIEVLDGDWEQKATIESSPRCPNQTRKTRREIGLDEQLAVYYSVTF